MHAFEWTRIVLALLIGTSCAFVAFESVAQIKQSRQKRLWTVLGGVTLGTGIWSTHYFGMLGWHTSFPQLFDIRFVLLSAAIAIVPSWIALSLSSQGALKGEPNRVAAAAIFTVGVFAMHLTGMAGLHLEPRAGWHLGWVIASALFGICAAYCGIRLLVVSHNRESGLSLRLLGAAALGSAIAGMHFFAMRAMAMPSGMRSIGTAYNVSGPVLSRIGLSNVLLFTFGLLVLSYRQSSRWMQMAHDARQEAHEAARQAERLASVGKIAASIAHEINNPLEAVVNLLYLIEGSPLEEESRDYLKQAQSEINRISDITTHTLKFYRQQSAPELTDIPDLFNSALTLFDPRVQRAGIAVRRNYDPEVGPMLCNAGEMRQVLANLVNNAIDAMSEGGILTLCTRQVGNEIEIEVEDTGQGISAEVQRQIFEPFFTTKGARGTGLGLSISAEIIARHAGRIALVSSTKPGSSGTRFTISLPLHHSEVQTTFLSVPEARSYKNADPLGAS